MRYQAAPLPEPALPLGQALGQHNPVNAAITIVVDVIGRKGVWREKLP